MKKYILAINLLALLIMISSCEDIIDADHNIQKTKITYRTIKPDQENDVIMPLKVGNLWVYKVTTVDNNGSEVSVRYDSVIVKKDTIISGEKWFVISNTNEVLTKADYATNTDMGLYFKDSKELNESYLMAEYPLKHSKYYNGNKIFSPLYSDSTVLYPNILDYWTKAEMIDSYPMIYGNFKCYKYYYWAEFREQHLKIDPNSIEYFMPNIGLVQKESYVLNSSNETRLKSISYLVYTNLTIGKPLKQTVFEIDFGTIPLGNSDERKINSLFENDRETNLTIIQIEIDNNPCFTLVNPPDLPYTVAPGQSFGIDVKFTPTAVGTYESDLNFFCTNNELLTVKIKGKCE